MSFEFHPHVEDHLNDDQFVACALGTPLDAAAAQHLAACDRCRAEVDSFAGSVASFNAEALNWSRAQPMKSLRPLRRERKTQPLWAVASWALAGCLALGAAVSVGTQRAEQSAGEPQVSLNRENSAAQIERDNKLMLAVYEATSSRTASPLEEYGLQTSSSELSAKRQ